MVAPNTGTWLPGQRGSDNAPMFTSELYVMIKKMKQFADQDRVDFDRLIGACVTPEGMLARVPYPERIGQEGPDDYLGVLNGCKTIGNTEIPRKFLWALVSHFGFMNNDNPTMITWESFLARQPQLIGAMVAAAFPSWKNPLHFLARLVALPFFFVAAVSIAISCIGAPQSDTDARRLSWHLQNTTKGVSLMCWLASLLWMRRLYKDFPNGMKDVAALYYQPGHPFAKYWIT
jgi:hypothetical protein